LHPVFYVSFILNQVFYNYLPLIFCIVYPFILYLRSCIFLLFLFSIYHILYRVPCIFILTVYMYSVLCIICILCHSAMFSVCVCILNFACNNLFSIFRILYYLFRSLYYVFRSLYYVFRSLYYDLRRL